MPSGAPVTTSAGADVVISLTTASNVTGISSGDAFVSDSTVQGNGWAHLITSSAGTYAAQWNQNPAGTYASSTVAFKAAGSVTLTSNNPLLTIPASVTVPVGASTATFSATAASFASSQSATITATLGGSSQTAAISLVAASGSGGGGSGVGGVGGGGGGGGGPSSFGFTVAPSNMTLNAPISGGTATQTVSLSVQAPYLLDGSLTFSSNVTTSQPQNWLSVSPSSGTLTLASGSADSSFTYTGTVAIMVNSTGVP